VHGPRVAYSNAKKQIPDRKLYAASDMCATVGNVVASGLAVSHLLELSF
jgi:hypothetical protein